MHKNSLIWLRAAVIGVLLCSMAFLIPSGSVVAEEADSTETYESLPLDDEGGPEPDESLYTETSYSDDSIDVEIFYGTTGDTDYIYAHITIVDPTQLRTASAGSFSYSYTYAATTIAKRVNAVIAINGDFYNHQTGVGYIIRQGTLYRSNPTGQDLLLIDSEGNFHGLYAAETTEEIEEYIASLGDDLEIWNVFSFGPILVEDGESVYTENTEYFEISTEKSTQRAGIGQLGPLEYYIVSTEGPEDDEDSGLTVAEFATLMEEIGYELSEDGATLAYNLDGGSSNTLVFNDEKINSAERNKIRAVGDIIYFATLVDTEE